MSKVDDMNAVLTEIKTDLANVSNDVDELIARATGGVTAAEADAFITDLTAVRDAVKAAAGKYVASTETSASR